jgi:hypothetical protein
VVLEEAERCREDEQIRDEAEKDRLVERVHRHAVPDHEQCEAVQQPDSARQGSRLHSIIAAP